MSDFEIIRTEAEGSKFLDQLSTAIDANSDSFGFVPRSRYQVSLRAGGLWILVRGRDYAGHVMFGGALPTLKIEQLFVLPSYREHGLGRRLIEELVKHAELEGYSSMRARVASDLPANAFWEHMGFEICRTVAGGVSTARIINVRLRPIQPRGAQMLMLAMFDGLAARPLPVARGLPINRLHWYTLDLNVLLDIVRKREPHCEAALRLMALSARGRVRLRFTSEAIEEARRNADGRPLDPLLDLVTSWPPLPHSEEGEVEPLVEELRALVFANRSPSGRHAANDRSDLRHLAISIYQKANGFITRDRALLRHRNHIWDRFGLDLLTPMALVDEDEQPLAPRTTLDGDLKLERVDNWRPAVLHFARAAIGEGARLRLPDRDDEAWSCSVNGVIIGLCYWHTQTRGDVEAFLCTAATRESDLRQRAFDVLLGLLFSYSPSKAVIHRVVLRVDDGTADAYAEDLVRSGFFRTREIDTFVKFVSGQPLELGNWPLAKHLVEQEIGATSEWSKNRAVGPVLHLKWDSGARALDRFDIETRFGITALTLGERKAFYIPIEEKYSNQLLPLPSRPELFTEHDASFRLERVYFRGPRSASMLEPGDLLFFYVSKVIGGLVGVARCTASQVLDHGEAAERYRRLAVLDPREVGDKVHCVAFDNYLPFKAPVTRAWLQQSGLAARNNFITISRVPGTLPAATYLDILNEGLLSR